MTEMGRSADSAEVVRWEGLTGPELARCWHLPAVHLFAAIGSTSDVARELGAAGAPAGTLVLAEEQTAGRGRGGRVWASAPGVGLWFSIVARPPTEASLATLPLHVGLAVARTLDAWATRPVQVKWPNDLVLSGRKMGGVLCEGAWSGGRLNHVVIGIGLNLLQDPSDFPADLRDSATSLRSCADRPISRFEVAASLLGNLAGILSGAPVDGEEVARGLSERDALRDTPVEVREPETGTLLIRGRAAGIATDGALMVRDGDQLVPVRSGTVRPVLR